MPSRTFIKLLTLHTGFLISALDASSSLFSSSEGEVEKPIGEAESKQAIQFSSHPYWGCALEQQTWFLDI